MAFQELSQLPQLHPESQVGPFPRVGLYARFRAQREPKALVVR